MTGKIKIAKAWPKTGQQDDKQFDFQDETTMHY